MKRVVLYLMLGLLCFSCIQKEAANTEADIETCVILNEHEQPDPNIKGNVIISNTRVIAQATPIIDLTKLALDVTLTEGATITPNPREVRDYSHPQSFVVTSEDGEWQKTYQVSVDTFDLPVKYTFELAELNRDNKYYVFYETIDGQGANFRQDIWASGNGGYSLTGVGKKPEDFPTVSVLEGKEGKGIKLETKSTGGFGEMKHMPIAAGNMFIGNFDVANALKEPMKATRFGLPFGKKPKRMTGWYKAKRGEVLTDVGEDGKAIPIEGQDACDIYAVLYESEGLEQGTLDGDNVLNSKNIVALARLTDPVVYGPETDLSAKEYIHFDLKFDYKKKFDENKSKQYKYNLAVVFTSSIKGATFIGAVGSVLYVDEVQVICE